MADSESQSTLTNTKFISYYTNICFPDIIRYVWQ